MATLNVAVIGAGHMGRLHAAKFAALPEAKLVAVADPDEARARGVAGEHGAAAVADYRQVFAQANAAVIAAPTDRHHEIAVACLEQGLHLLIEKPIATSLAQADELLALARKKGLVLQVGHVERYNRAFGALVERMDRPLFIDAERLAGFKQRGAEVDVVLDLMIHDIDLALTLASSAVADVSASGFRVLTGDIDIANARIEFASGCVANLSASRVSQAPVRKLRVFQPDLYVSADLQAGKLRYVRQVAGAIEESEETHAGGDALAAQAAAFAGAVLHGRPIQVSGESGRQGLALALDVGRLVRERLARFG